MPVIFKTIQRNLIIEHMKNNLIVVYLKLIWASLCSYVKSLGVFEINRDLYFISKLVI